MSPSLYPVLMIGSVGLFILVIFWSSAAQSKRARQNLQRMADELGLNLEPSTPTFGLFYGDARAAGTLRGKQVEVYSYSTGSGKSRVQWSAVAATPAVGSRLTFFLRPQSFSTKVMEAFGWKEIEVGDAEFDRAWFVQTNQPEYFRAALLPELRMKLMALTREPGVRGLQLKLDDGAVRYAERGTFSNAGRVARIPRAAELACDLADLAEVFAASESRG